MPEYREKRRNDDTNKQSTYPKYRLPPTICILIPTKSCGYHISAARQPGREETAHVKPRGGGVSKGRERNWSPFVWGSVDGEWDSGEGLAARSLEPLGVGSAGG